MHYWPNVTAELRESLARPGDRLVLRALIGVVAAVSASGAAWRAGDDGAQSGAFAAGVS